MAIYHPRLGLISTSVQTLTISYTTEWIQVIQDPYQNIRVYHYEGTKVSIINITQINNQYVFSLFSTITQNSLLISSFNVLSVGYLNSSMLVLAEANLGLVFVSNVTKSNSVTYVLNSTFRPPELINLNTLNSQVSSMVLLSDANTAFLIMQTADVYQIFISNLTVVNHFPKILQNGRVPSALFPSKNENQSIIAFPVFTGTSGVIRILNYSQTEDSAIYKDRILPNSYVFSEYEKRITFGLNNSLIHNLSPVELVPFGLHFILIRISPMGYINQGSSQYNGSVALLGYSKGQTLQYPPISYYYPGSYSPVPIPDAVSDIFKSNWNTWYFWVILSLVTLFVTGLISWVVVLVKNKKSRKESFNIGLTSLNS